MNYIQQINAFYDWLMTNPLSADAQCLYLALLHINNKAGWKERFSVANITLQSITSISRSELHKKRNVLMQKGLIDYKSGSTQQAGIYTIIPLSPYETKLETNTMHLSPQKTNLETNHETNLEHINKTKRKPKETKPNIYSPEFESFWREYPKTSHQSKSETYKKWSARMKEGHSVDEMISGAQGYALFCKDENREEKYMKNPETFLGPDKHFLTFIDYKAKKHQPSLTKSQSQQKSVADKYNPFYDVLQEVQNGNNR